MSAFHFLEPDKQFEVRLVGWGRDPKDRTRTVEIPKGRARVIGVDRFVEPHVPMLEVLEPTSPSGSPTGRSFYLRMIWKDDRARVQALIG